MIQARIEKTGPETHLAHIRDATLVAAEELARIDAVLDVSEARIAALSAKCASYQERHAADEIRRIALESERNALATWAQLVVQEQTRAVESEIDAICEALQRVHESPVWRLKAWIVRLLRRIPRADKG